MVQVCKPRPMSAYPQTTLARLPARSTSARPLPSSCKNRPTSAALRGLQAQLTRYYDTSKRDGLAALSGISAEKPLRPISAPLRLFRDVPANLGRRLSDQQTEVARQMQAEAEMAAKRATGRRFEQAVAEPGQLRRELMRVGNTRPHSAPFDKLELVNSSPLLQPIEEAQSTSSGDQPSVANASVAPSVVDSPGLVICSCTNFVVALICLLNPLALQCYFWVRHEFKGTPPVTLSMACVVWLALGEAPMLGVYLDYVVRRNLIGGLVFDSSADDWLTLGHDQLLSIPWLVPVAIMCTGANCVVHFAIQIASCAKCCGDCCRCPRCNACQPSIRKSMTHGELKSRTFQYLTAVLLASDDTPSSEARERSFKLRVPQKLPPLVPPRPGSASVIGPRLHSLRAEASSVGEATKHVSRQHVVTLQR